VCKRQHPGWVEIVARDIRIGDVSALAGRVHKLTPGGGYEGWIRIDGDRGSFAVHAGEGIKIHRRSE